MRSSRLTAILFSGKSFISALIKATAVSKPAARQLSGLSAPNLARSKRMYNQMILATGNTKATFVYDPTKNPVRLDYSPDGSVAYAGNKE